MKYGSKIIIVMQKNSLLFWLQMRVVIFILNGYVQRSKWMKMPKIESKMCWNEGFVTVFTAKIALSFIYGDNGL